MRSSPARRRSWPATPPRSRSPGSRPPPRRPEQVVGLHFFNPVPVLPLVEIVASLLTAPQTVERVRKFATDVLGKTAIQAQDRAGFVVNSLLVPYLLAAIRMHEAGYATAEDIDNGMVAGLRPPDGSAAAGRPDRAGHRGGDRRGVHEEYREPQYAPAPSLLRMVEAGLLARSPGAASTTTAEPAARFQLSAAAVRRLRRSPDEVTSASSDRPSGSWPGSRAAWCR